MISKIMNRWNNALAKKYILPYKRKVLCLYIITILSNILVLLPIYYMGTIINYVMAKEFKGILYTIFALCLIFFGNAILSMLETYLSSWLNNEISKKIKDDIYNKATRISVTDFQKVSSGHIISLIEGDVAQIADFFVSKIIGVLVSSITLIVSLFFLFRLSATLSIIAIISFPLGFIGTLITAKKINNRSEILRKISDENYTFLNRTLNGIKEIKAYVLETKMLNKFNNYTEEIKHNNIKITICEIISGVFNMLISSIAEWVIIGYGTWKIINKTLTIGAYVAFNGYLGTMFGAVKELLNINVTFRTIEISFKRVEDFFGLEDEKICGLATNIDFNNNITFSNVTFAYDESSEEILHNFSAVFKKHTLSVVIGTNGVGKSTMFSLIEQFHYPQKGNIFIGNHNINNIDIEYLRKNIGLIQQHPMILEGTLRENLVYGVEDVQDGTLDAVCSKVGLTDFVNNLREGYNTKMSEISGGQQQRIAIARVLVKNPPILLLDEITSDLDGKSENDIISLLKKLSEEKTIVLVSHRINAIINIPNIYVMEQGNIICNGSHTELLEKCPLYSMLINSKESQI